MKVMLVKDRNVLNTRFLTEFANSLSRMGYQVVIACDSFKKAGEGEQLDCAVKFVNLSGRTDSHLKNMWTRFRKGFSVASFRYARLIRKEAPDVIVCYFLTDLFNVAFMQPRTVPIILMGHNYPPETFQKIDKKNPLARAVYRHLLHKVDVFQVLLPDFVATIDPRLTLKQVVVIPNAVRQFPPESRADLQHCRRKIIYVARFSRAGKRQHLLIEAFAKVADRHPGWVVELWGLQKGNKYIDDLDGLIASLHLQGRVLIKGYTRDIYEQYQSADINAFPSKREGFGLGLAEGMAIGLPSIGFADAPGVRSLIQDGRNGFLVKDVDDFAQKLDVLMSDQQLRIRLGLQATKDMAVYHPERVAAQWDELLQQFAGHDGGQKSEP